MSKIILIFWILFLNNCSFDNKSGIWTKEESLEASNQKVKNLFKSEKVFDNELNSNYLINTPLKLAKGKNNNDGLLNHNLNLEKISRYKFSRIDNFNYFDPSLVFYNDDLIFFDKKGSILRFDNNFKIIWKKNFYTKIEKKTLPILNFSIDKKTLLVTDNLSKYYALDIETGKKLWSKSHNTVFISEIKIDNDKFYLIDSDNIIYCFSLKDGSLVWEFNTENQLIKSQKKLSIVTDKENIYFLNSVGNLYSLDKNNGNLIWITPTKDTDNFFESFLLKTSELLLDNQNLYLSNNANSFFSIDKNSGFVNWKQNINSEIKPIIVNDMIFSISSEGCLFVIDKTSGNILRITDTYNLFKKRFRDKIKPTGFLLDINKIYLSLNNGKIVMINISDGRAQSIYKITRGKISKPFINKNHMFIVENNEIVKLN